MRRTLLCTFLLFGIPLLALGQQSPDAAPRAPERVAHGAPAAESPETSSTLPQSKRTASPVSEDPAPDRPTPLSLLQRAYDISRDLPADARVNILPALCRAADHLHLKQGKNWAEELFKLADDLPPASAQHDGAQFSATQWMARFDVDRALELLDQLQATPAPDDTQQGLASAARIVFQELVRKRGLKALTEVRQRAQRMGDNGQYPYSALMPLFMRHRKGVMEDVQPLFNDALEAYRRSSTTVPNEMDFAAFLHFAARRVPPDVARDAAGEAAGHVIRLGEMAQNDTNAGASPQPGQPRPAQRAMTELAGAIREIDPRLCEVIEQRFPALAQDAEDNVPRGLAYSSMAPVQGAEIDSRAAAMQRRQSVNQVRILARRDPMAALAAAQSLQDPQARASVFATLALTASGDLLQKRSLFESAEKAADAVESATGKLAAYEQLANTAAGAGDPSAARAAVEKGFALLDTVMRQQDNDHPENKHTSARSGYGFLSLARVGAQSSPEFIIPAIENVPDPEVRAFLLISAAEGLKSTRNRHSSGSNPIVRRRPNAQTSGAAAESASTTVAQDPK